MVSIGENLTEHIQTLRTGIDDARASINEQFNAAIDNINALAQQLAELNTEIVSAEGGGIYAGSAGSLRDQRDAVLRELSDLVSISTFEQTSGAVEISVGSHTLVSTGEYFGLSVADALDVDRATGEWITNADELTDLDKHRIPLVYAVFDIDGSELVTEGGLVHGYLVSRDESLAGQADALDTLTESLIFEMNKIHSEGSGTASLDSIRSLNAVSDADAALTDAGLHWRAENGAFSIRVHDLATGLVKTVGVEVDLDGIGSDDTLNSLAGKINAAMTAAGVSVTATVNSDNTLSIDSGATDTGFTFCDDTSNLLACLGINTFFSGYDSANIGVNALVSENIGFVAAALSTSPDDGSNAVRMVDLRSTTLDALGGLSMEEYYQSMISDLGIESSVAGSRSEGAGAYRESLLAERESISGVNMDEEAINLMRYQRAYQAAAHYITIIDELLQTMLNIV